MSLFTKVPQPQVKHYHIKQNNHGFYLSEKHCCNTIPELIEYHSYNAGGLACRLKCPPGRSKPPTAGLSHGKWEIDPTELTLLEELGKALLPEKTNSNQINFRPSFDPAEDVSI